MIVLMKEPKLYRLDQSWYYETLWELLGTQGRRFKAKVEIRRNAYDFQSWGKVFIFSKDETRWNSLAETAGPELKCLDISYVERDRLVIIRDHLPALRLDTLELLQEVCQILDIERPEELPKDGLSAKKETKKHA